MSPDAQGDAKGRAAVFLAEVAKSRKVWGLRNKAGGLATWAYEESEETLIPFWSGEEAARLCAEANFAGYAAFEMTLDYFKGSVLPQLAKKGILVGVNFSDRMGGVDLPAAGLISEIEGAEPRPG